MKILFLLLIIIVAIEFNLTWLNNENTPNWVRAWDNYGQEVKLIEERVRVDEVWNWRVRTEDNQYNWFFQCWWDL